MIDKVKAFWKNRKFGLKRKIIGSFLQFMIVIMLAIALLYSIISTLYSFFSITQSGVAMLEMAELRIDSRDIDYFRKFGVDSTEYVQGIEAINKIKQFGGADDLFVVVPHEDDMDLIYDGYFDLETVRNQLVKNEDQTFKSIGRVIYSDEHEKSVLLGLYSGDGEYAKKNSVKLDIQGGSSIEGVVSYICYNTDEKNIYFDFAELICDEDNNPMAVTIVQYTFDGYLKRAGNEILMSFLMALVATFLLVLIFDRRIHKMLISPLAALTAASTKSLDNLDAESGSISIFSELDFDQQDNELGVLYNSFLGMEKGINSFVDRIRQMTNERNRIEAELDVAARIQASYVPTDFDAFSEKNGVSLCAAMVPAKEVGGDFYDFFNLDDDHLGIVIADVSGKGVPASMFMMIGKTLLKDQMMSGRSISEVIRSVNNSLCANNAENLFITLWAGMLTLSTGELCVVNAGHESPIMYSAETGECWKFDDSDKHGMALGMFPDIDYTEYTMVMKPGDRMFLFTDGVSEATNSGGEIWGCDRVMEAFERHAGETEKEILSDMWEEINEFVGEAEQFDDITMLLLRR